jgi:hypothetical protein
MLFDDEKNIKEDKNNVASQAGRQKEIHIKENN